MAVNDSVTQNLLPVQAYFDLQGNFQTFIGQNKPFYATTNPIQSGLTITNSTIDSTIIGANSPAAGTFTNITTTTGTISTTPVNGNDIVNKSYVDATAQGLSFKQPAQVYSASNISLSGLQTIDGYTTVAGDRVLVNGQSTASQNGIYVASSGSWSRSADANTWNELLAAFLFIENGTLYKGSAWVCTVAPGGTIGVTPVTFSQFSNTALYTAGTGLTLNAYQFSITNTSVTAGSYGSASSVPTFTVNAQGQLTAASNTTIAIANTQVSGLGTMSTQNANSVAITGGSINGTTIGGSSAAAITGTTITATSSFSGSGSGLTGTATGLSIGGNAATATTAGSATTATTATNIAGGSAGALPYQTSSGTTTFLSAGSNGQYLTLSSGVPAWTSLPTTVSSFSAGTTGFTPSSATTGAITLSGTLNVANGGTGVTSSSGANSVVLRDSNQNVFANNFIPNTTFTVASSTPINLTVASAQYQVITGSVTSQTFNMPDATTLSVGDTFYFNNNITYSSVQINAHDGTTSLLALQAGGAAHLILLTNSTTNGTWDVHSYVPSTVSWGTATLNFNSSSSISGSVTWQGNLVGLGYGGTNANLTATAGGVVYSTASALAISSAGTTGQFLQSNGTGAPTWATPVSYATVTDDTTTNGTRYPLFANQTSGNLATEYTSSTKLQFNPSTGVFTSTSFSGAGTGLTGTASSLSIGGNAATATSATSATTSTNLAGGLAGYLPYQSAVNTTTFLAPGTNGYILTLASGLPTWAAAPATGVTITDDTSSATAYYPLFARVTSGTATTEYTSSTKLNYTPSTGLLAATSFSGAGTGLTGTASGLSIGGTALNVTGTVAVANGGTGLTSTPTNGQIDIGNGTNFTRSTITGTASQVTVTNGAGSITLSLPSTINVNTSGNAANVTGTVAIANGGTGQTTASAAFNALSPITSTGDLIIGNGTNSATRLAIGTSGYVLTSNGTTASWAASSGATVTSTTSTGPYYIVGSSATSGSLSTAYVNTGISYNASTGDTTTPQVIASNGIFVNNLTVGTTYSIPSGYSAHSVGPVTVASGKSVTVPSGSRWVIL